MRARLGRVGVGLAVAVVCAGLAAVAGAAEDPVDQLLADQEAQKKFDVGPQVQPLTGIDGDTDHTPDPKASELWRQVAGAKWPGESPRIRMVADSPTSIDADLYDVAFRHTKLGFAGGAACPEPVVAGEDEDRLVLAKRADECRGPSGVPRARVPVIYRYTDSERFGQRWDEVYRGKEPGYVGAIAFTAKGVAVAVGGTGRYPKRELSRADPANQTGTCPGEKPDASNDKTKTANVLCYEDWVRDDVETVDGDGAGLGRAWRYEKGRSAVEGHFDEIDLTGQLKEPEPGQRDRRMRGMSALDFHPAVNEDTGAAGALGQIWHWRDGGFVEHAVDRGNNYDSGSSSRLPRDPETNVYLQNRKRFLFRVREIRFMPEPVPQAFAVTAGCCAEDELRNTPVLLAYSQALTGDSKPTGKWNWYVRNLGTDPAKATFAGPNQSGGTAIAPANEDNVPTDVSRANLRPAKPDSYYSLIPRKGRQHYSITTIATPGGHERSGYERPSIVPQRECMTASGDHDSNTLATPDMSNFAALTDLTRTNFGTARLVSGDGDTGGFARAANAAYNTDLNMTTVENPRSIADTPNQRTSSLTVFAGVGWGDYQCLPRLPEIGDGFADWLVGELRSTRIEDLGTRGLAFASNLPPKFWGGVADAEVDTGLFVGTSFSEGGPTRLLANAQGMLRRPTPDDVAGDEWEATSQEKLEQWRKSAYLLLPSFSINAIDMVGPLGSESGPGWAVGERGAILSLDAKAAIKSAARAAEPEPPRLSNRSSRRLAERTPFEPRRPKSPSQIAEVPGLAAQPRLRLEEPRLHPHGSPDPDRYQGAVGDPYGGRASSTAAFREDVAQIVISRDGSEGWALGASRNEDGGALTLFHYDGQSWSRCDVYGIFGATSPDPACEGVEPLRQFRYADQSVGMAKLQVAARVPYENDDDPSNDDEFEVLAIGTEFKGADDRSPTTAVARYRQGRWAIEPFEARDELANASPVALAFSTPEEGFLLTGTVDEDGIVGPGAKLFRYDGEHWHACPDACPGQDPETRLANKGQLKFYLGANPRRLVSAGKRVYLFGSRRRNDNEEAGTSQTVCSFPLLLYKDRDPDGVWTDGSGPGEDHSGWDPGWDPSAPDHERECAGSEPDQGEIHTLAIARRPDGRHEGWAFGEFDLSGAAAASVPGLQQRRGRSALARLTPGGRWKRFDDPGSAGPFAHMFGSERSELANVSMLISPSEKESSPAFITGFEQGDASRTIYGRAIYGFDRPKGRWDYLPHWTGAGEGPGPMAPDGEGGFWLAASNDDGPTGFSRYTQTPPKPVFEEASHPIRPGLRATAMAGAPDGSLWVATDSDLLARYDRMSGWETIRIPGWDPGRATRSSRVNAIALAPSGTGLAVGEDGRIAELTPGEVRLDPAAGILCKLPLPTPPCATGRDLTAVAVSPEGAAIAGGERLALLWRPPGGELRAIEPPEAAEGATFSAAAMPSADRAYVATNNGLVFRGDLGPGGEWAWTLENLNEEGALLSVDWLGNSLPITAMAVDAKGHGYAVGYEGLILERSGDGYAPWRRLRDRFRDDLTAVALPAGEGEGALIGGKRGLILTRAGDRFVPAHYGDPLSGPRPIAGLALLPGVRDGQAEAWAIDDGHHAQALTQSRNAIRLFHHASDEAEPLLDPAAKGAAAIPDSPAPRPGETTLAAFGKTECHGNESLPCRPMARQDLDYETILDRTIKDVAKRSKRPGGPRFVAFTGDAVDSSDERSNPPYSPGLNMHAPSFRLLRFRQYVFDHLAEAGLPSFAAIGSGDQGEYRVVVNPFFNEAFYSTKEQPRMGDNLHWRWAFEGMQRPWGAGPKAKTGDGALSFEPLRDRPMAQRLRSVKADDPDDPEALTYGSHDLDLARWAINAVGIVVLATDPRVSRVPIGGASTHYAADIVDRSGDRPRKTARLIVLDNSWRSLKASDPIQQPIEADGGQKAFLETMLCLKGTIVKGAGRCTREPGQAAIVLANTPTYSYGQGAGYETASDGSEVEQVLLANKASAVISGRVGINGLYWALAPGVHEPCPGQPYQGSAPEPGARVCDHAASLPVHPGTLPYGEVLAGALGAAGPPPPPPAIEQVQSDGGSATGVLPFVIASAAGGKFGTDYRHRTDGPASQGFWHGYSIVRVDASGDPAKTIVEQRPILDWLSLSAPARVIRPGQRMSLRGVSREPVLRDGAGGFYTRYNAIDAAGMNHRYDLLEADPERPWTPRKNAEGAYVPLDPSIATIDPQTGRIQAGRGNRARAYAVAALSAGCKPEREGQPSCERSDPLAHVATLPLVFEPRRSFVPRPAPRLAPPAPAVRIQAAAPPPPATNPPPTTPGVGNIPTPTLPNIAPPPAPPSPPQVKLPDLNVPPAPPVPPSVLPIQVTPTAVSVAILPLPGVFPQPAPPIQPAPPSGARREARQRQAATEKSGSDSGAKEGDSQYEPDMNEGRSAPPAANMTGLDRTKPAPSFTPAPRHLTDPRHSFTALPATDQPSAWARGALYGGGLGLAAILLAGAYITPRPKPRPPAVPAAVYARAKRR